MDGFIEQLPKLAFLLVIFPKPANLKMCYHTIKKPEREKLERMDK